MRTASTINDSLFVVDMAEGAITPTCRPPGTAAPMN